MSMKERDQQHGSGLTSIRARKVPERDTENRNLMAPCQPAMEMLAEPYRRVSAQKHADTVSRSLAGGVPRSENLLLQMQRHHGNRHVQRVLALARQGDGNAEVAPEVEQAINRARGGGQALDSQAREQMEPAFGTDFSDVRVHTGPEADTLNRAVCARAFTIGRDIFFRDGEYNPGGSDGRELLAHELTHVVQQRGGAVQTKLEVSEPGDECEQEADRVASAMLSRNLESGMQGPKSTASEVRQEARINPRSTVTANLRRDEQTVIPIDVIEVPQTDMTMTEIVRDNINSKMSLLLNYETALRQFELVVALPSKKEAVPRELGEIILEQIRDHVIDKIVDKSLEHIPGAKELFSLGKQITKSVEEEKKRSQQAAVGNALLELVLEEEGKIGEARSLLTMNQEPVIHETVKEYQHLAKALRVTFRDRLLVATKTIKEMRSTTHSAHSLFQFIAEKWIGTRASKESEAGYVFVRLDKDWRVVAAHIHAPYGQKLAERLLSNSGGRVKLNEMHISRVVAFAPEGFDWVTANFDQDGAMGTLSANPFFGQKYLEEFLGKLSKLGLPETSVLTGD